MVNYWTLFLLDRKTSRCWRCIGFPESMSFSEVLAFVSFTSWMHFYRSELCDRSGRLVYRGASF